MATWIVGGVVCIVVGLVLYKMIRDKRAGKSSCACGGNCASCHAGCSPNPK